MIKIVKNYQFRLFWITFLVAFLVIFFLSLAKNYHNSRAYNESYYLVLDDSYSDIEAPAKQSSSVSGTMLETVDIFEKPSTPSHQDQVKKALAKLKLHSTQPKQNFHIAYNYPLQETSMQKTQKIQDVYQFLFSSKIDFTLQYLYLDLYQQDFKVRGNMSGDMIKMYGVEDLSPHEFLSVFIHEYGHYVDMAYLKDSILLDKSDDFYKISWQNIKILYPGQNRDDFVSGYAMTNQYEDFAESFTYYVLFNQDFYQKAQKSVFLKEKYNFFSREVFVKNEFQNTNFAKENSISHPWDTTKIPYFLEKFLKYLKSSYNTREL